jgi:hypothetical protein
MEKPPAVEVVAAVVASVVRSWETVGLQVVEWGPV